MLCDYLVPVTLLLHCTLSGESPQAHQLVQVSKSKVMLGINNWDYLAVSSVGQLHVADDSGLFSQY